LKLSPTVPFEELRLSKCQAEILAVLLSEDRWWPTWELWEAMAHSNAGPEVIKVFAFHLKRKLRAGISDQDDEMVASQYARGYRLTSETRTRLLNWNTNRDEPETDTRAAA
jgi:hypothetical protein